MNHCLQGQGLYQDEYTSYSGSDDYYSCEEGATPYLINGTEYLQRNLMDKLFKALAQKRNEIREAQRKIEIQLDLMIKLATLVIEYLTNSQPSNSENLPSQPLLSNPSGSIGTVFLCTNQEGREDALLNEEDVEKTDDQLGALEELLEKKEEDLAELDSRFNAYSEHLYKLQNNRAKGLVEYELGSPRAYKVQALAEI
ncbi:hypothetical protein PIB30_033859 [Stylosanthes scabra]|uniref:Uncharacterized protein n=1 Tax=Stylosanthes scabra TaxID=79078 RepID=A0ABU6RDF1_9FABA|nr:hypothetical protein [Stylosanthes scabra]